MAVVYPNAIKVARMNAVVTAIGTAGKLKLFASGPSLVATFVLAATAGTVTGAGVLTISDANGAAAGILNTTASAAGVAITATITTSADVDVITGLTAGTSGTDIVLDNNNFTLNQAVTMNTGTITHA